MMRIAIALMLVVLASPGARAQTGDVDRDADAIFHELMSPFCPGLTLADCPSPNAFVLRDDIKRRLAAGEPKSAILAGLVQQYGAAILADPSATPIGALAWGLPIALAIAGAFGIAWLVKPGRRTSRPGDADEAPADLEERLDEELRALD